jgi:DNA-binding transcriptional ArsR family regulator
MELVRKILLETEEASNNPIEWMALNIEGYDPEFISYHVKIMKEAGLIDAENLTTLSHFEWQPKSLTLDVVRNETVWAKTKEVVKSKGGSVGFEVLKELAIQTFKSTFMSP